MPDTRLTIPSGDLTLEGRLRLPDGAGPFPAVVVCHPHPRYGGDMQNNVVTAVARGLVARGIATLCFNFRGVGHSGGAYDDGQGERDDVRAALAHAASLPELDAARIGLAGYSFGAGMAASVAGPPIPALALVALPLGMNVDPRVALHDYPNPLLLIAGDQDHVCPAAALTELAGTLSTGVELRIVMGTDHFWAGYERELGTTMGAFFNRHLRAAQ